MADKLHAECPAATPDECRRFLTSFGSSAVARKKLQTYLDWRHDHNLDSLESTGNDHEDWELAVQKSLQAAVANEAEMEATRKNGRGKSWFRSVKTSTSVATPTNADTLASQDTIFHSELSPAATTIPQLLFCPTIKSSSTSSQLDFEPLTDTNGNAILHCLPAQIDLSKHSAETYTLIFSIYLHLKLDRSGDSRFALLVDVRPGPRHWPNPPVTHMLGFLRVASSTLQDLLPQRLSLCLVLNVPKAAVLLFDTILRPILFLQSTKSSWKLHLLAGELGRESPVASQLVEYLRNGQEGVDLLERARRKAFMLQAGELP